MTLRRTIVACFLLSSSSLWAADQPHPLPPPAQKTMGFVGDSWSRNSKISMRGATSNWRSSTSGSIG